LEKEERPGQGDDLFWLCLPPQALSPARHCDWCSCRPVRPGKCTEPTSL